VKKNPATSFKWIISSQYFLYFGVMGIFLPYFNLYCYRLNFTGFEIGVLSAIRSVALILTPLIWGSMADRFQIRRPIYMLCSFISTGIWAFYLFTSDFWAMLVITVFYGIFYSPIISFLEAFAMDVLDTEKKSYGKLRGWGSIAFIITVVVLGKIIDLYSIEIILSLIFLGSLVQAMISIKIPDIQIKKQTAFSPKAKALLKKRVVIFLFCAFLMLVSHGTYYGFYSIHLDNLGYDKTFIGFSWALASIAEITVMIKSDRIFQTFSIDTVLFFSFIVAAFRWIALSFATSPVFILFLQMFHAVTYAMFHVASILYIDASTPDEAKTLGQSINNAVTYGLGLMVGFFINGYLFETLGSFTLFRMSGFIALGGGILLKCSQMLDGRAGRIEDRTASSCRESSR
jgi:MFS transporter, PPP family, 3-phenylpropionic acid transporter